MAKQPNGRRSLIWERAYPYVVGTVSGLASWLIYTIKPDLASSWAINAKDVVEAIFDVALAGTALLFSVYVLALAPSGGFLERIVGTRTFVGFRQYVVQALVMGALLFFLVLPFSTATAPVRDHGFGPSCPYRCWPLSPSLLF
jgi:hypothetical protein